MKIEHLPINWVNGVKLTKDHFFGNYYNMIESLYGSIEGQLTDYNYGIGRAFDNSNDNVEFDITGESLDTLCVRLKKCNGLTRGGIPIIFYEGLYGDYVPTATLPDSNPLAIEDNVFLILVSINPYEMIPIGEPDPEVVPLHHPHVLPSIKMHIIPKSQTNKAFYNKNFLIIGEIKSHGNAFAVNRQYIPPLQKSVYHDGLKSFINQLTHILHNIREDIRTIYSRNLSDKRRDALANNTFVLCNAFSSFL